MSAPAIARFPCCTTSSCSGSSLAPYSPPVSASWNDIPLHDAGTASESRVVPAIGATIARREPMMRLKRVDFPTLGRPTSTTEGNLGGILSEIEDHLAFALTA